MGIKGRKAKHTQIFWRFKSKGDPPKFEHYEIDKELSHFCCTDFDYFGRYFYFLDFEKKQGRNLILGFFLKRIDPVLDPRLQFWYCMFCGRVLETIKVE